MKVFVSVFILVLSIVSQVFSPCLSQETVTTSSDSSESNGNVIDQEKKEAITELLEITEIDSRIELLDRVFKSNAARTFRLTVMDELKTSAEFKDMSKDDLRKAVVEKTKTLSSRYNELYSQQIKLGSIVKKIAYDIYAKYFSANEIKDIVAFYKTPTGIKARKVMPKLSRESMLMTQEFLKPKLKAIVEAVLLEDKKPQSESTSG